MPRISGSPKSFPNTTKSREFFNSLDFDDKEGGVVSMYYDLKSNYTYLNAPFDYHLNQTSVFHNKSSNWYINVTLSVKHGDGKLKVKLRAAEQNSFFYFTINETTNGKFAAGPTAIYNMQIKNRTYVMKLSRGFDGRDIPNLMEKLPFLGTINTQKSMWYTTLKFHNVLATLISLERAAAEQIKLVEKDDTFGAFLKFNLRDLKKSPYELVNAVKYSSMPHANSFELKTTQKFNYHDVFTFENKRVQAFGRDFNVAYTHPTYGENYKEKSKTVYKYMDKPQNFKFKNPQEISTFSEVYID